MDKIDHRWDRRVESIHPVHYYVANVLSNALSIVVSIRLGKRDDDCVKMVMYVTA